ncbi:MAG: hypothetical protein D6731_26125 [Planctomycetota bacterium]|nr:MAG: hypothetical protein D6731_26125 [Planctomycetota bacterium]
MRAAVSDPSPEALRLHRAACREGADGYVDPTSGRFVFSSFFLRARGRCCGSGCRHCPFDAAAQRAAGRPPGPAWPWPQGAGQRPRA